MSNIQHSSRNPVLYTQAPSVAGGILFVDDEVAAMARFPRIHMITMVILERWTHTHTYIYIYIYVYINAKYTKSNLKMTHG